MSDSQGNHKYDMILGHDKLSELQIYLCFSNNTIRVNGGMYEVCTSQIKYITNITPSAQSHDDTLRKNNCGRANMHYMPCGVHVVY